MSVGAQICPVCGTKDCVRLHQPGRHIGSGTQSAKGECRRCLNWRVLTLVPEYNKSGEITGHIDLCNHCLGKASIAPYEDFCGSCGKFTQIRLRRDDGVFVGKCCYHGPVEPCYHCQKPRLVQFRLNLTEPVCTTCYQKHYQPRYLCSDCGETGSANLIIPKKGPVCRVCYQKRYRPKHKCVLCRKEKFAAVLVKSTGYICRTCYRHNYQQRQECSRCGNNLPVAKWVGEREAKKPICHFCYRKYYSLVADCFFCKSRKKVNKLRESNNLICRNCYTKLYLHKHACFECGRVRRVAKWVSQEGERKAVCHTCYVLKFQPRYVCFNCGQLKPVNKWLGGREANQALCKTCDKSLRKTREALVETS